ncbi:tRNA glutamyl-Q(34) synthetase GluQRS [Nostoc sp. NIES-2111]
MLTRLAPSPSGDLHIGHARAFLAAWALARSQGGTVRLRIEDLDGPRVVPGAAERQMEDLRWLGLDWDGEVLYQSARTGYYDSVLAQLIKQGLISACYQSRQDVARAATAPHGPEGVPPYPIALRPARPLALAELPHHTEAALRFSVPEGIVQFDDLFQGSQQQDVLQEVGDFVLRRRDGLYAYQLAVVADDIAQGVTHIVRGADLLFSTARQIQLWQALGAEPPVFGHVGLVLNAAGEKLSKRDGAVTLRAIREQGTKPQALIGHLAASLGIGDGRPCTPSEVANRFAVHAQGGEGWIFKEYL